MHTRAEPRDTSNIHYPVPAGQGAVHFFLHPGHGNDFDDSPPPNCRRRLGRSCSGRKLPTRPPGLQDTDGTDYVCLPQEPRYSGRPRWLHSTCVTSLRKATNSSGPGTSAVCHCTCKLEVSSSSDLLSIRRPCYCRSSSGYVQVSPQGNEIVKRHASVGFLS